MARRILLPRQTSFIMCTRKLDLFLNSKILANHFKELCANFLPPFRETNAWMNQQKAKINENIVFFLFQIGRLIQENKIDGETFKNEIKNIKDVSLLKVEILWYLQIAKLLSLTEFIQYHEFNENVEIIEHISNRVFEIILDYKPNESEVREAMVGDFLKALFECFRESAGRSKVSFYRSEMNLILIDLKRSCDYEENFDVEKHIEMSFFMKLIHNLKLPSDVLKQFLQEILMRLMESSGQSFKSIFRKQEKLKGHVQNKKIYGVLTAVSEYSDPEFLVLELKNLLSDSCKGLNWDHMFCFITFVGLSCKDGWSKLKTLSNSILKKSFQNLNAQLLSHVFLISRQACFERTNNSFPSYLQWFSSSFSSESRRPINCKRICKFFFDFLTELLPYDPPYYLKVHINRVPWVPSDCISIPNEYVTLVKTQLSDLNISSELGICENLTDKSAPVFDVENVLKHFERTNDILSSVFQAAMFCKDYYEKKFLAELLKKFDGKKSVRHKFIMKLHSLGKIPNLMFKVYKALEKK